MCVFGYMRVRTCAMRAYGRICVCVHIFIGVVVCLCVIVCVYTPTLTYMPYAQVVIFRHVSI
jgi:hypothetical protein